MKTTIIAGLMLVSVAAQARHSTPAIDPAQFERGKSTATEVLAKLGSPMMSSTTADGGKVMTYFNGRSTIKAASFVPIVGLFAGGMKLHSVAVTFTFGPDGLLKDYRTDESNMDTRNGR